MQCIPFIHAFYAFESPLFYSRRNCESDVIVITFAMGTNQGDPLGKALFELAFFRALCFITSHFLSCLFPSIVNDTHIISPPFIVSSTYVHFQTKLYAIGLSIQPHRCVTWSFYGLPLNFNTPSQFTTPLKGIRTLGFPLGTSSFM